MAAMQVDALYIHPLKSGRAQAVSELEFDERGPLADRRFVAFDAEGRFVSQREWPELGAISARWDGATLQLTAANAPLLSCSPRGEHSVRVRVWADEVLAQDCGDAAANWLSARAGRALRLAYQGVAGRRAVRRAPTAEVSFADGYPLLVVSRAALDELARRLGAAVADQRFRPNIVIAGCAMHAEDGWKRIAIGGQQLDLVKPCERCSIPALDPDTHVSTPGFNRALAAYRSMGGQVYFGMNAIHRTNASIRIGDRVELLEANA